MSEARKWEATAMERRPWRTDIFERFASEIADHFAKACWLGGYFVLLLVVASVIEPALSGQDGVLAFSCATFPAATSEAQLAARFGAQNVTTEPVFGFDDGPSNGTVLFPANPAARVEILWRNVETKSRPAWIKVHDEPSQWRTANGITIGTDLLTLERMNGRPFRLAGFRNEISGRVRGWAGGRLELPSPEGCSLAIQIYPRPQDDNPRGAVGQVARATDYSSGHPAMRTLNPRVVVLMLTYDQ